MFYLKWRLYSPDGGAPAGDGGAEAGVASGDPGPSLEDLGVPADRAEKFRQRKQKSAPKAEVKNEEPAEPAAQQAAPMSFEDFIKIPENNQRLQQMMSDRVARVARDKTEYMSKLSPALELIASRYGIQANDDGSYDADAITKAIQNDDSYYEQKAMDMGVDVETARRIDQLETENKRNEELLQKQQRDQQLREHFMKMQQQAKDVQSIMPGFNLQDAINDPKFMRLTSPEVGMSVKEAIWALHGDEIQQQAVNAVAKRAKVDAANAIRSGYRPRENGSSSAAVSTSPNLKTMTREDRRAYIMQKYRPPDR
jgi:hypothetical protein